MKKSNHSLEKICPLCKSENISLAETIDAGALIRLYNSKLGIDIGSYVSKNIDCCKCNLCGLGFFNPTPLGDSGFYEQLQSFPWYYMHEKPEYEIVKNSIITDKNISLLEVGGGSGQFAIKLNKNVDYTGLEFNDLAIKKASSLGIDMLKLDLKDYSKKEIKHDYVVSFQVLEHIENPGDFLEHAIRCLKPNGHLVIAVPNKEGVAGIMPNIPLDLPPHHATHWNIKTLEHVGKQFGLEVIDLIKEPVAPQHIILARKYIFLKIIASKFISSNALIQSSMYFSLANIISSILSRFVPISVDGIDGHTIIGIFKNVSPRNASSGILLD